MTKRLAILQRSLERKEQRFDDKLGEHFATVKQANGQPLNDKRNGAATLRKWERQNEALRGIRDGIERTKRAIDMEEGKIADVADARAQLPQPILDLIDNGTLTQWRKHPFFFFVAGVDKARLHWDRERQVIAHRYTSSVTDKEQWRTFARVYNALSAQLNKPQQS